MLHELLLVLLGHPSSIFLPHPPPPLTPNTLAVRQDFPFLHKSERSVLDQLAQCGWWYSQLVDWAGTEEIDNSSTVPIYLYTFRVAVESVLDDYRTTILSLEEKILRGEEEQLGRVSLGWIKTQVDPHSSTLRVLYNFKNKLTSSIEDYHGCKVLDAVYKTWLGCSGQEREVFGRILLPLKAAFFKHVTTWCIYGQLFDPQSEFFIKEDKSPSAQNLKEIPQDRGSYGLNNTHHAIDKAYIPSFIRPQLAETIFFIGKACGTIQASSRNSVHLPEELRAQHIQLLTAMSTSADINTIHIETTLEQLRKDYANALWQVVVREEGVPAVLESFRSYFLLGKGDFWHTVLREAELFKFKMRKRLTNASDYELNALLRRASLGTTAEDDPALRNFRFTFPDAAGILPKSNRDNNEDSPSERINLDNDTEKFLWFGEPLDLICNIKWPLNLIFTPKDMRKYQKISAFLLYIRQTHMRLQQLHFALTRYKQKISSLSIDTNEMKLFRTIWNNRSHMESWITNLESWIQIDIIESSYVSFISSINSNSVESRDFGKLQMAHSQFIDHLCGSLWLTDRAKLLRDTVSSLCCLIDKFVGVVNRVAAKDEYKKWEGIDQDLGIGRQRLDILRSEERVGQGNLEDDTGDLKTGGLVMVEGVVKTLSELNLADEEQGWVELDRIGSDFNKQAKFFYLTLNGIRGGQMITSGVTSRGSVESLLIRLDMNKFYSVGSDYKLRKFDFENPDLEPRDQATDDYIENQSTYPYGDIDEPREPWERERDLDLRGY
ncbi:Spc98 family-domain-containing protein [Paraphysoderma sedebokerense]|nr:Spc98 family-domain-containing protein [Paraphysoderma sedebokerense]